MRDLEIIELLGEEAILEATGANSEALHKWKSRGIPWRLREKVRELAKSKRKKLPPDFGSRRAA